MLGTRRLPPPTLQPHRPASFRALLPLPGPYLGLPLGLRDALRGLAVLAALRDRAAVLQLGPAHEVRSAPAHRGRYLGHAERNSEHNSKRISERNSRCERECA